MPWQPATYQIWVAQEPADDCPTAGSLDWPSRWRISVARKYSLTRNISRKRLTSGTGRPSSSPFCSGNIGSAADFHLRDRGVCHAFLAPLFGGERAPAPE